MILDPSQDHAQTMLPDAQEPLGPPAPKSSAQDTLDYIFNQERPRVLARSKKPPKTEAEQVVDLISGQQPKTFGTAIKETGLEQLPVVGQVVSGVRSASLYAAAKRLERGEPEEGDEQKLSDYFDEQKGGETTFGYDTAKILTNLPAYAIDFMLGGGLTKAGLKFAEKKVVGKLIADAVKTAAENAAETKVGAFLAKRGAGAAADALVESVGVTASMPGRIVQSGVQRGLQQSLGVDADEAGHAEVVLNEALPSFLEVAGKGAADQWIENLSEYSGGAIAKVPGIRQLVALEEAVVHGVAKATGKAPVEILQRLAAGAHWDHIVPEMGEEEFGKILHSVLQGDPYQLTTPRELLAEAAAFTAMPVGNLGLQALGGAKSQTVGEFSKEKQAEAAAKTAKEQMAGTPDESAKIPESSGEVPPSPAQVQRATPEEIAARPAAADVPEEVQAAAQRLAGTKKPVRVLEAEDSPMVSLLRERGIPVNDVDAGKPLKRSAMTLPDGSIVRDAHAPSQQREEEAGIHELVHVMGQRYKGGVEELASAVPPEWLQRSGEDYNAKRTSATGKATSEKKLREESVAHLLENMVGVVKLALRNPERIVDAVRGSFWQNLADGVITMGNAVGLKIETKKAKRLRALRDEVATGRYEKEMDPQLALNIALLAREYFDRMVGYAVPLTEAPARPISESIPPIGATISEGAPATGPPEETTNAGNVLERGEQVSEGEAPEAGVPEAQADRGPEPAAEGLAGVEQGDRGADDAGARGEEPAAAPERVLRPHEEAAAGRSDSEGAGAGGSERGVEGVSAAEGLTHDQLVEAAKENYKKHGRWSASLLQRTHGAGYTKAAAAVEQAKAEHAAAEVKPKDAFDELLDLAFAKPAEEEKPKAEETTRLGEAAPSEPEPEQTKIPEKPKPKRELKPKKAKAEETELQKPTPPKPKRTIEQINLEQGQLSQQETDFRLKGQIREWKARMEALNAEYMEAAGMTPPPRPDGLDEADERIKKELEDLFTFEPIDEDKYAKASKTFDKAVERVPAEKRTDERSVLVALIEYMRDTLKLAKEKIQAAKEYVTRYAREYIERVQKKRPIPKNELPPSTSAIEVKPYNFRLKAERDLDFEGVGAKGKAEQNIAAIRLLKDIEAQGRNATMEEKELLVRYVGWGGLAQEVFPVGEPKAGWHELAAEVKALLTPEEYAAAKASTTNAHYTSWQVVASMWMALEHMGFKGKGSVLEPGMGIGHFLGMSPRFGADLRYVGIERDPITARIAKQLYGLATVNQASYEDVKLPKDYFDIAIGNPPFADITIKGDPEYAKLGFSLHDYFFAKSIDRVRPGGIIAFVTSRYSLDKMDDQFRNWVNQRAEFLGAIRLPNTAFKQNAGTQVVTDIIFLRKRERGAFAQAMAGGNLEDVTSRMIPPSEWVRLGFGGAQRTSYYSQHPEMVMGSEALVRGMHHENEYSVKPTGDLFEQLKAAIKNLPKDAYKPAEAKPKLAPKDAPKEDLLRELAPETILEGGFYLTPKGTVMRKELGEGVQVPTTGEGKFSKAELEIIKSFIPLRQAARAVLRAQVEDKDSKAEQAHLKRVYDEFVKKHGPVNKRTTTVRTIKGKEVEVHKYPNYAAFEDDPEAALVGSLDYWTENGELKLSQIFTEKVVRPDVHAEPKNAVEAAFVSLNQTGKIEIPRMAKALGKTEQQVVEELGDRVFLDPKNDEYILADEYLSGNVREKLREAEQRASIDKAFQRNVDALRPVIPADIPSENITARFGVGFVSTDDYNAFIQQELELRGVSVTWNKTIGHWEVVEGRYMTHDTQRWGINEMAAHKIIQAMLDGRDPEVKGKDAKGNQYTKVEETEAAKGKAREIRERWQEWLWKDEERKQRIVRTFNDEHNNFVNWEPDGSHLHLPGSNFPFRRHQLDVIWRAIRKGNAYVNHAVGAGKTAVEAATCMELKRLGLVSKPMVAVPNHMLRQFASEFLQIYPTAKILVADEESFSAKKRKLFAAKAANNKWDAIVFTHSALNKVPLSSAQQQKLVNEEIARLEAALEELPKGDVTRKDIEKLIEKRKQRLKDLQDEESKDKVVTFEEIGGDFLVIDEAHEFRKMDIATTRGRVKGITTTGSARAWDLYGKIRYLETLRPGRSTMLASGTPVTNTLGELYTVQRYLQSKELEDMGAGTFDGWVNLFAREEAAIERNAKGEYKAVTRLSRFVNLRVLSRMLANVMDTVTSEQLDYIKRPTLEGGGPQIQSAPNTEGLKNLQKSLIEIIDSADPRTRGVAYFQAIRLGSFGAIDLRTVDPTAKNDPSSKLNLAVAEIHKVWSETAKDKLTQMVFCDLQSAKENPSFDIHDTLKAELVRLGIPEGEILLMRDLSGLQKQAAFKAMNKGEVRILIGGRSMETGVNAQRLLYVLHHLDVPWYPATMIQREGRIVRQKNLNDKVRIVRWTTEGTIEVAKWQALERKATFISQVTRGIVDFDEIDDIDESASYALAKAVATGDSRIIEMVGLEGEVQRLGIQMREHEYQKNIARAQIPDVTKDVARRQTLVSSLETAAAEGAALKDKAFEITVDSGTITDREEAAKALAESVKALEPRGDAGATKIGKLGPFDIVAKAIQRTTATSITNRVTGNVYYVSLSAGAAETSPYIIELGQEIKPAGLLQSLEAQARQGFATALKSASEGLQAQKSKLARMEEQLKGTFKYAKEYEEKAAKLDEIKKSVESANAKHDVAQTDTNVAPDTSKGGDNAEDEDLYAIEPEDRERIEELAQQAEEEGEETVIGSSPYRRTPLSEDAQVRARMRAMDEWRLELGQPDLVKRETHERRAAEELESDYAGTVDRLTEKMDRGELLLPWETLAISKVIQDRMFSGSQGWMELADRLRGNRADLARVMGVLRDTLDARRSGRERMVDLLSEPSRRGRIAIARLKRKMAAPLVSSERKAQLMRMLAMVQKNEEALTKKAKERLNSAGYPPALVATDYFRDPITRGRIVRIVSTSKNNGVWDWFIEYNLFSMLSGLLTQKANLAGNTAYGAYNVGLRRLMEVAVNAVFKEAGAAQLEELRAMANVQKEALMNSGHFWLLAMQSELPVFEEELTERGVKTGKALGLAARSHEFQRGPSLPGPLGRAARATSLTMLLANDEAAKAYLVTVEATALAVRAAKAEGVKGAEALEQRAREILSDYEHPIHLEAYLVTKKSLFQEEPGTLTKHALRAREWLNEHFGGVPLGTLLFPFVVTPAQIFKAGLREAAMPLIYFTRLAHSAASGEGRYRGDKKALVQDTAHALTSTLLTMAVLSLAYGYGGDDDDLPIITGSEGDDWDAAERGAPAYSVLVGGRYRSYARLEPLAVSLGTLVDLANAVKEAASDGPGASAQAAMSRLMHSVVQQASDKTFLQTFSLIYEAAKSESATKTPARMTVDLASRIVPNIIRQPMGYLSPVKTESGLRQYDDVGIWEAGMTKALPQKLLPISATRLPPRYDLWGRAIPKYPTDENPVAAMALDLLSPLTAGRSASEVHKLDRLLMRYNEGVTMGTINGDTYRPKGPNTYWSSPSGKIFWSDDEYATLSREGGRRAVAMLENTRLNYESPTEQDKELIAKTIARARHAVAVELYSARKPQKRTLVAGGVR